jgi:type II secretory pathway component PulF
VPLERALESTAAVVPGPSADAVRRIADRVREGSSLTAAMHAEGALFSTVTLGLVRAGESGAGLEAGLAQAATQLERQAELEGRIRVALAYPALLLLVGCGSIALIVLVVVPRFASLFADVEATLPPATRILLGVSGAIGTYGGLALVLGAAALIVAIRTVQAQPVRWHEYLLRLPIVGGLRHALATSRACRTLASLLGAGQSALPALDAARASSGDRAIAARLDAARARVSEGASLSAALGATRALTPTAIQLVAIGEGSGQLERLLARAADLEESVVERRIKLAVSLLEPALILLLAVLVAFVAAALLQAVYGIRPGAV